MADEHGAWSMAHVMEESEDQVRNWVFGNQDSSVRFEVVT